MEDNPQEILDRKLNNPNTVLTPNQSISLVSHCAELGDRNAADADDKNAIAIAGVTGSGKSTTANYWLGCDMVRRTPEEQDTMGIQGALEDVIIVDPNSTQPEVAAIGHDGSQTFMPQIVQDPNHQARIFVDCPDFGDTRGAEINIANAINIKKILRQAREDKSRFLG